MGIDQRDLLLYIDSYLPLWDRRCFNCYNEVAVCCKMTLSQSSNSVEKRMHYNKHKKNFILKISVYLKIAGQVILILMNRYYNKVFNT